MIHAGPGSDPRAQVTDEIRTEAECPGLKRIGQIGFPFRRIETALRRRAGQLKALFGRVDAEEAHGRAAFDMKSDRVAVRDRRAERLRLAARFTTHAPDGAHAAIRSNENFRHRGHDQAPPCSWRCIAACARSARESGRRLPSSRSGGSTYSNQYATYDSAIRVFLQDRARRRKLRLRSPPPRARGSCLRVSASTARANPRAWPARSSS